MDPDVEDVQLTAVIDDKQAGQRLDQVLAVLFNDYSRSRLQQWILSTIEIKSQQTKFLISPKNKRIYEPDISITGYSGFAFPCCS